MFQTVSETMKHCTDILLTNNIFSRLLHRKLSKYYHLFLKFHFFIYRYFIFGILVAAKSQFSGRKMTCFQFELPYKKTNNMHRRKQRGRSAVQ